MKCLGISSALSTIGASIVDDDRIMAEFSLSGDDAKSEKLVGMVDTVLKKAGISFDKVDSIAVTKGPGSYSGLRGGMAMAKSFAGTADLPIIGVSTLEAIAFNLADSASTIAVVVHACKDEYNIAMFAPGIKGLKRLSDDLVVSHDRLIELLSAIKGEMILAAEDKIYKEVLKKNPASRIRQADARSNVPWAVNVAMLGTLKLKAGERADYLSMTPDYSHRPNIREFNK